MAILIAILAALITSIHLMRDNRVFVDSSPPAGVTARHLVGFREMSWHRSLSVCMEYMRKELMAVAGSPSLEAAAIAAAVVVSFCL